MAKTKEQTQQLQGVYKRLFTKDNPEAVQVLEDLARFCRANESCFHADVRIHANLEGRREVFLRIMENLQLTPDEYWALYGRART